MDMDRDMDLHQMRGGAAFPIDQPLEALKHDHNLVRKLFDSYLNTQNENVKREAGPQLLMLLEMHSRMEETVFYPQVQQVDPSMVGHFEQEHQQTDELIQQLKSMDSAMHDATGCSGNSPT